MKRFLFILTCGTLQARASIVVGGKLPSIHEIAQVENEVRKETGKGFVVVDFKEIAND